MGPIRCSDVSEERTSSTFKVTHFVQMDAKLMGCV
jgi:hypothetical protein